MTGSPRKRRPASRTPPGATAAGAARSVPAPLQSRPRAAIGLTLGAVAVAVLALAVTPGPVPGEADPGPGTAASRSVPTVSVAAWRRAQVRCLGAEGVAVSVMDDGSGLLFSGPGGMLAPDTDEAWRVCRRRLADRGTVPPAGTKAQPGVAASPGEIWDRWLRAEEACLAEKGFDVERAPDGSLVEAGGGSPERLGGARAACAEANGMTSWVGPDGPPGSDDG